jgi:hypothetical protein
MAFSCQHGCISGTPFMFNWTHPAMPGDVSAYVSNPYLSNHPFIHPFWLSHKPKTHAACVMQCLAMGNAALKDDCIIDPLKTYEIKKARGLIKDKDDAIYNAKHSMSASCMQGCSAGIPFMFNWTDPLMPGVPVSSPNTWMLGLTSHLGHDDGGSLGSGDYGTPTVLGSPMSPFNPPSEIANGPADRESCISQCLSMGHDAVASHDKYVMDHKDKAASTKVGDMNPINMVTEMQKTQMFYTCAKGW